MRTTRPSLKLLAIATAVAAVAVLAPITPATAQEGVGVGSGSGSGSGGNAGGGSTTCVDGAGYSGGRFIYQRPYPACPEYGGNSRVSNTPHVAPVGLEVWRFYGHNSSGSRVRAWTTSEAVLPEWGSREDAVYSLFVPHPADASGRVNGGRSWGPWATSSGRVVNDWERVQTWAQSSTKDRLATSAPFNSSNRSCASLQNSSDPLKPFFTKGTDEYDNGELVRHSLYTSFRHWVDDENVSSPSALASINSRGSLSRGVGKTPRNGDDIDYDDNLDCSSGLDFIRESAKDAVLFGVCYVPTEARYFPFANDTRGFTTAGSVRYVPGARQGGFSEYRETIYNEVRGRRAGRDHPMTSQPYLRRSNGRPILNVNEPSRDANVAALAASRYARCTQGIGSVFSNETDHEEGQDPNGITLGLQTPEVINVGGKLRPVDITVTSGQLRCDGKPCTGASAPRLLSLDYNLRVRSNRSSYTACSTRGSVPASCDLNIIDRGKQRSTGRFTGPDGKRYTTRVTTSQRSTVEAFRSTTGAERVVVDITNARARYVTFDIEIRTLCVTGVETEFGGRGTSGAAQPCDSAAPVTTVRAREGSVSVSVPSARHLRVIGGNLRIGEHSLR